MQCQNGQPEKNAVIGRTEVEECRVEPAFAGADDLDGTGYGATDDCSDRDCGDTVMPLRELPELESLDGSRCDAANWTHFSAAGMDEHGVDAAIKIGHDRSLQKDSLHSAAMHKTFLSARSWRWTATTKASQLPI